MRLHAAQKERFVLDTQREMEIEEIMDNMDRWTLTSSLPFTSKLVHEAQVYRRTSVVRLRTKHAVLSMVVAKLRDVA